MAIQKKHNSGFSLMELMIVVVLIGVLTAIAFPSYLNARYNAIEHKAITNLYFLYQAQKLYYFDNPGTTIAPDFDTLSPDYATLTDDDGTWKYTVNGDATVDPKVFLATANYVLPDGTQPGDFITIDENGEINTDNWTH